MSDFIKALKDYFPEIYKCKVMVTGPGKFLIRYWTHKSMDKERLYLFTHHHFPPGTQYLFQEMEGNKGIKECIFCAKHITNKDIQDCLVCLEEWATCTGTERLPAFEEY